MLPRRMILALAVVLAPAAPALAMRVVGISVQVDGQPLLTGQHGDQGGAPPAVVWRYLRVSQLGPVQGASIAPDPDNPLRATLRGDITVEVRYGGKATVKELHLVRQTPTAGWTVAQDDVERMARDVGLGTIPVLHPDHGDGPSAQEPPPRDFTLVWVLAAGLFVLVIAGVAVLFWWSRRAAHPPVRREE